MRYDNIKGEFKSFKLSKWTRDLVGILKLSFAIMLLNENLEIVCLGAQGITVLIGAALLFHLLEISPFHRMLRDISLLCLFSYIDYLCFSAT